MLRNDHDREDDEANIYLIRRKQGRIHGPRRRAWPRHPGTNSRSYKIVKTSDLVKCLSWCICYISWANMKKLAWIYTINSSIIAKKLYSYVFFKLKISFIGSKHIKRNGKNVASAATQLLLSPRIFIKEFFSRKEEKNSLKHCKITFFSLF